MRCTRLIFPAALVVGFMLCTHDAARAAWPHDPFANLALAPPAAGDQIVGDMLSDGLGGVFTVWTDKRGGTEDLYLQRVTAAGAIAGGWPVTGFQVCTAIGMKMEPQLASDGAGGVYVEWADYRAGLTNGDIWAQHVLANGTLSGGWPAAGLQLTALPSNERRARICGDGAGGLFAAWEYDYSATDTDIYGAHVNFGGSILFSETIDNGLANARQISVAPDITGGLFVAYQDSTSGGIQVFGTHVNGAGGLIQSPVRISTSIYPTTRKQPHILPDGSGGIIASWMDNDLNSNFDIAFMRLGPNFQKLQGFFDLGSETSLGISTFNQDFSLIGDGQGGFYAAWQTAQSSAHICLIHYSSQSQLYPGWTKFIEIPLFPDQPSVPQIVSDGSGGVIVAGYPGITGGGPSISALRVTAGGALGFRWASAGMLVSAGSLGADAVHLVTDGAHGGIVGWSSVRASNSTLNLGAFAQRIDLFGALGNAEPTIVSIKDAPKDNGGNVRLIWNASYLDADPGYEIGGYWIWRQTPAVAAARAVRAGAQWLGAGVVPDAATLKPGRWFLPSSVAGFAWEYLATQGANASAQYSFMAPTSLDSTASSNSRTTFMVEARSIYAGFWDSPPDSGYSVDNLPPVAPAPFFGQYSAGSATLGWGPNSETDLAGYLLYRGANASFTPSVANLVAQTVSTNFVDANVATAWYKLAAIDAHGNVSPYSTLLPTGALDAGGPRQWPLAFAPVRPDPAVGPVTLAFTTPHAGVAALTLVDAQGRAVRHWSESVGAGPHEWTWTGDDARGAPVAAGLYFARFTFAGRDLVRRFVRIR